MAQDVSVTVINGRLVRDAESKKVGEATVTEFSLAWNGYKDSSHFIDCAMWGREGVVPYLVRGKQVSVVADLEQEKWEAKDGTKRSKHKLRVRDLQLLGGKQDAEPARGGDLPVAPVSIPGPAAISDPDQIPF